MTQTIRRLIIHGRVQGVGYRAWTVEMADARGLKGWVRNRKDGTVEAVVSGTPDEVAAMIASCREGPAAAEVTHIDESAASASDLALRGGKDFVALPTI